MVDLFRKRTTQFFRVNPNPNLQHTARGRRVNLTPNPNPLAVCCNWLAEALHCSHSRSPSEHSPAPRPSAQHPDEPEAFCAASRGADRLLRPRVLSGARWQLGAPVYWRLSHELIFVEADEHGWIVSARGF